MPHLLLLSFTDQGDALVWRAFSSTDEDRSLFRLRKDVFYEIGYQESYPDDKSTTYGTITQYFEKDCDIALEHRFDGIQLVITPDHTVNGDFGFLTATETYSQTIPEGHTVAVIPHTFVDPNAFFTAMAEPDSDSD